MSTIVSDHNSKMPEASRYVQHNKFVAWHNHRRPNVLQYSFLYLIIQSFIFKTSCVSKQTRKLLAASVYENQIMLLQRSNLTPNIPNGDLQTMCSHTLQKTDHVLCIYFKNTHITYNVNTVATFCLTTFKQASFSLWQPIYIPSHNSLNISFFCSYNVDNRVGDVTCQIWFRYVILINRGHHFVALSIRAIIIQMGYCISHWTWRTIDMIYGVPRNVDGIGDSINKKRGYVSLWIHQDKRPTRWIDDMDMGNNKIHM